VDELLEVARLKRIWQIKNGCLVISPPDVANHPDVRGRKGNPNRMCLPYRKHRDAHRGPGGGEYNRRFDELIRERGGYEEVTVRDILDIRNDLVTEFGLPGF
jgi:hypothetical protein